MNKNTFCVRFLYGTVIGRFLLKVIQNAHLDRWIVRFLRSRWSRPVIGLYAKCNGIPLSREEKRSFKSYGDFFVRERGTLVFDNTPGHLISPCDGWLSVFPVGEDSCFAMKGSRYRLEDLVQDKELAEKYHGGVCLIFRLCASDCHHYCYIDDGYQGANHPVPGVLHSVQPIACETYPVFVLNTRCWSLLLTDHFGPVVQIEIGALVVGGIVNEKEHVRFRKGMEKGHFELAGSTIVLLFERDRICLLPELRRALDTVPEVRVRQGERIGEWSI